MKIQNVQSDAAFLPTCFLFFIYQRNAARADIGSDDRTDFYIRDCNVTDVRLSMRVIISTRSGAQDEITMT